MARTLMGVVRNSHGVYVARRKVPDALQGAVAQVMNSAKSRVVYLQETLGTKDQRDANIRAKPILMKFDRVIAQADALMIERPVIAELSDREIERIAQYHFASVLVEDEETRTEGTGSEALHAAVHAQVRDAGVPFEASSSAKPLPEFGLSDREMKQMEENIGHVLPAAEAALARGDISFVAEALSELQDLFRINLDRSSPAYRKLGMAVLKQDVRALKALEQRQQGQVVTTPALAPVEVHHGASHGETLMAALEGWKKARSPGKNTLHEFQHAVDAFRELHGDMPLAKITRRHVLQFREALQDVPTKRTGPLRKAALPELAQWGREHPNAPKVSAGTVNKLLGAVAAVAVWGRDNGLIPDDVPWPNAFERMSLETRQPERTSWDGPSLNLLFSSAVFIKGERSKAGGGEAAFWLPLLGLFTGARLGELAPLRTSDIERDARTGITSIAITEDASKNKRLKTISSRRTVPVHPELVRLGFLKFVEARRKADGADTPIFPLLKPGPKGGVGETWSKWFGRFIRSVGITDTSRVFHSFRHSFKDALRAAGISEDINDALTGHSGGGAGRGYGSKDNVHRFGLERLAEAVAGVTYEGLKLPGKGA